MQVTYCQWRHKSYVFAPRLWSSLVCTTVFILLIALGYWQLHRYHYKQGLLAAFTQQAPTLAVSLQQIPTQQLHHYKRVKVAGQYLNDQTMLLINRTHHGKIGQDVITPLKIAGDPRLLLVNRGWKPQLAFNRPVTVPASQGKQQLTGYLFKPHHHHFMLGANIAEPQQKPLQMQQVNTKELSRLTGRQYYPVLLRLDPDPASGFVRAWPIVNSLPAKHLAYAVQWFAMALVLFIAYLFLSTKIILQRDTQHEQSGC